MPRTSPRLGKKRSIDQEEEATTTTKSTMWGSKKKRSQASSSSPAAATSTSNTNSSGLNTSAVEQMFAEIADPDDPQTANMEGIFALGEKLGMDATEDIRILVLLWKMNVRDKPSQLSQSEWIAGCTYLQVDSWTKMRDLVPSLDTGFLDATEFKEFYKFCFVFSRQGTHKSLETDLVVALLKLVLLSNSTEETTGSTPKSGKKSGERVPAHRVESFATFLEERSGSSSSSGGAATAPSTLSSSNTTTYTHISLDQWTSFLDFCMEMDDDLSNYDESTSAWPVILDEYVEYMEEQMKKK